MSITDKVRINTHYTRSINLERDHGSIPITKSYILTSCALRTLSRISNSFDIEPAQRAWSLVGPFGAGKSAFAIFLAHLLGPSKATATKQALKLLSASDKTLAKQFKDLTDSSAGYCLISLTGSPGAMSRHLAQSLLQKAESLWMKRGKQQTEVIKNLRQLTSQKESPGPKDVMDAVRDFREALSGEYAGLLIVIDELGKFLEYEARHYGANDIFLLQGLAEQARTEGRVKLGLVVLLHQTMEHYSRGLGKTLRNEWAKVQGRFENIPFIESAEQVLRVFSAAIDQDLSDADQEKISLATKKVLSVLTQGEALPVSLEEKTALDLFARSYPMHPLGALILPTLCQKFAQNERTLFSYLGSSEDFGFHDGISRCQEIGDWIYPWEIFDYFILNQPAALSDHFTHRRWAEVVTALERLGDGSSGEHKLLKSIGLLNIIGAQGNLKASKEIIELCLPTKNDVHAAIESLTKKNLIQYRKFSAEYRVWQGSDFDLDAHVDTELNKLGNFSLSEKINNRHNLPPVVARRYSIQNGALRYFMPIFADASNYSQRENTSNNPRIIFFLAESQDDEKVFSDLIREHFSDLDIVVLIESGEHLREIVGEVLALEEVRQNAQALNSDPVAHREFEDRYDIAMNKEVEALSALLDAPASSSWFWKNKPFPIKSKRELQVKLSLVLESAYSASPIVKNELINRASPSSQANAAKNKLARAMLEFETYEDLGFEKFPAEKAIYRAVLHASRLHVKTADGKWKFQGPQSPSVEDDPCHFYPTWNRITSFLASTEKKPKSLVELNIELMAPPYGVMEGVLPILYLAALFAHQEEIAIYEDKVYCPHLSPEQIERFLKRPDTFTVQRFFIEGVNRTILENYSRALFNDGKERSLLSLAKPLARFLGGLPENTQQTALLSEPAKAVRNSFKHAKSPAMLLLSDIPNALGITPETINETNVTQLSDSLLKVLRELKYCHQEMCDDLMRLLAQGFSVDQKIDFGTLREIVRGRCLGLEKFTIDRDGLAAFILRLTKEEDNDAHWRANLLMFLGQKPTEKWNDLDRNKAEFRLSKFIHKLNDLEKLRIHEESHKLRGEGDFDIFLLRSVKKGGAEHDKIVTVNPTHRTLTAAAKKQITHLLNGLGERELGLATLAEVVDEYLTSCRESSDERPVVRLKKVMGGKEGDYEVA